MSAWPPRDDPDRGVLRRASLREMQQLSRAAPARAAGSPGGGAIQLEAGGYGFGLRVWQTCEFRHVVAHSGGLPGFGSHMRWLPEHGVGILTLGNLTYTSWGGVVTDAFQALARTGGLSAREPQPSPALVEAREAVSRLIAAWDDRWAESLAAENLFLDESTERRRSRLEELRRQHGACRPEGPFEVENALRGRWNMSCERGGLRVAITLAPTMPPRVQMLAVRPLAPGERPAGDTPCQP
jgi:hypothetical protein